MGKCEKHKEFNSKMESFQVTSTMLRVCYLLGKLRFPSQFNSKASMGFKQGQALGGHPKLSLLLDIPGKTYYYDEGMLGWGGRVGDETGSIACPLHLKTAPSSQEVGRAQTELTERQTA